MNGLGLIPLRNFAIVDENKGIYRSAQPMYSYEYKFLKEKLNLTRIINLRSELDHDNSFAPQFGMAETVYSVPDHCTPTLEQATDFIKLVQASNNILFHCEHGQGRTSLFCVLSRLATGWKLEDAMKEEKEVYGYDFKHPKQVEFLNDNFSNYNV